VVQGASRKKVYLGDWARGMDCAQIRCVVRQAGITVLPLCILHHRSSHHMLAYLAPVRDKQSEQNQ
jgi:hypothetical protein